MDENQISRMVIGCCLKIHRTLGPGLFESVYEEVLIHELCKIKLSSQRQVCLPVVYDGIHLDLGFRVDIIIEQKLIVELKSIETLTSVHKKQLLTYLKLTGLKLGLLVNFNEELMRNGIIRVVNNL